MDYDVIVVGGGGAGMSAAIEAATAGKSVLIADAGDRLGGSTRMSGGVFYAGGSSVQRAAGVTDDTEETFRYYMVLNQYRVEPSLVRKLCEECPGTLDWLIGLGADFPPENIYQSGVDGIARGHRATGQGEGIANALEAAVSQLGIDVSLRTRVRQLHRDDDGAVRGIVVDGQVIRSAAVVLASGGFGASHEKLAHLYPEAAAGGDWTWYIGADTCKGDGLDMGTEAGGEITGHDKGLLLLTPGFGQDVAPYQPAWLSYVNRDGRRFINETTEYSVVSGVVKNQPAGECFAIFDEASRLSSKSPSVSVKNPWSYPQWDADSLERRANAGEIYRADDLTSLAEAAGIRVNALESTVEACNHAADTGVDALFFKAAEHLRPIKTPPFYAVRLRPAVVCLTSAGLRIDACAAVLSRAGRPIEGLFAAGEITGGVMGERYVGGGNSISNAIVFGRIAGQSAARAVCPGSEI